MQKITPFIWFDDKFDEAMNTYVSLFRDGEVIERVQMENHGPEGTSTLTLGTVRLAGLEIKAGDFGPEFSPTPAISFFVECESADEVDRLWNGLIDGGFALMELGEYPFSPHYGWLQDRFGINWQISQSGTPQKITPFLMYVGDQFGRAEEAMKLYTQVFDDSSIGEIFRGEKGQVSYGPFTIAGQSFTAMEDDSDHKFTFTEGLSLFVDCEDQAEVDRYWNALTANGGEESQCGWLKDPFGVSWQIIPRRLMDLQADPDQEKAARVTQAMLQMRKIEVDKLEEAANAASAV
jgi:predicted 3-demethylubiquinone-9 3-methyltransferase (glyoxalase superfamily)